LLLFTKNIVYRTLPTSVEDMKNPITDVCYNIHGR